MINDKKVAIDARMIESSGIGEYIKHIINSGIYDCAIGNPDIIGKYSDLPVIEFCAAIYSMKEQLFFPMSKLKDFDLIHFPHYNVPFFFRKRFVVTIHDLTHIKYWEFLPNKLAYYYAKVLLKHDMKCSKKILTDSEYTKQDIKKTFKVKSEKIFAIPIATDRKIFRKKKESELVSTRLKFGLNCGERYILFVGNLKPHKNLNKLIEAVASLNNQINCKLVLVGRVFKDSCIDDFLKKTEMADRVVLTGFVTEDELVDLYNIATVFAFPSLYEGFGLPPLEAMACGTPVVCSNTSSIPEVVGAAGEYFDPRSSKQIADALFAVLGNSRRTEELIELGVKRVENFSWEETVNNLRRVLSDAT